MIKILDRMWQILGEGDIEATGDVRKESEADAIVMYIKDYQKGDEDGIEFKAYVYDEVVKAWCRMPKRDGDTLMLDVFRYRDTENTKYVFPLNENEDRIKINAKLVDIPDGGTPGSVEIILIPARKYF